MKMPFNPGISFDTYILKFEHMKRNVYIKTVILTIYWKLANKYKEVMKLSKHVDHSFESIYISV